MSKRKFAVIMGMGAVVVIGVAASVGNADWMVAGHALGGVPLQAAGSTGAVWQVTLKGTPSAVRCKSIGYSATLEGGGATQEGQLTGTCEIEGNKSCSVTVGHVSLLRSQIYGVKGAVLDEIEPESGTTFAELEVSNSGSETCEVKGTYSVVGKQKCSLPSVETEANTHEVVCPAVGSELTIEGNKVTFEGTASLKLPVATEKWSGLP